MKPLIYWALLCCEDLNYTNSILVIAVRVFFIVVVVLVGFVVASLCKLYFEIF